MKILSPIDKVEETIPLIKAGVDEFYCGVIIDEQDLGSHRKGEKNKYDYNVSNLGELAIINKLIKKQKKKIFIALNSIYLNNNKIKIIKSFVKKIEDLKVDGVIISDFRLIDFFKKTDIKMIASSFLETKNEETVKYLKNLGFDRVILDRHITYRDLEMVNKHPELEFEAFIMHTACRSMTEYCTVQPAFYDINPSKNIFHPIHACYGVYKIKKNNKKLPLSEILTKRLTCPTIGCGGCAIYDFNKLGIKSLKIVGRGFSSKAKIRAVEYINKCIELLERHKEKSAYSQNVKSLFAETFNKECNHEECYYPHFIKKNGKSYNYKRL